jgi:hypothetical protein
MVDGETSVMMVMKITSKSPSPAECQNRISGSKSRFLMAAAQRKSIWKKNAEPPLLSGQRVYVGGRRGRGDD